MEPLNDTKLSVWLRAFWGVYTLTPKAEALGSVYRHLYYRLDWPFAHKDK